MGRDFTIFAKQPGYVRFYSDKKYPGQTSMRRINLRKYCTSRAMQGVCVNARTRPGAGECSPLTRGQAASSFTRTSGFLGTKRRADGSGG